MVYSIDDVIDEELHVIKRRRARILREEGKGEKAQDPIFDLLGLSLSGGGIRSALFNLGVLQGLSRLGILRYVDIMTSVSGGGYIAGCLSALLSARDPREKDPSLETPFHFKAKSQPLFSTNWTNFPFRDFPIKEKDEDCPKDSEGTGIEKGFHKFSPRTEMRHLRSHSNYLLPGGPTLGNKLQFSGALALNFIGPFSWFTALVLVIIALYMAITQLFVNLFVTGPAGVVILSGLTAYLKNGLRLFQPVSLENYVFALLWVLPLAMVVILICLFKKGRLVNSIMFVTAINILLCFFWCCLLGLADIEIGLSFLFIPLFAALFCFILLFLALSCFRFKDCAPEETYYRFYTAVGTNLFFMVLGLFIAIMPFSIKKIHFFYLFSLQGISGLALRAFLSIKELETGPESKLAALKKRIMPLALNVLVVLFVFLYASILGKALDEMWMDDKWLLTSYNSLPLWMTFVLALIALFLLSLIDFNRLSNFTFYDMRLSKTFLYTALTMWPGNRHDESHEKKAAKKASPKEPCQTDAKKCDLRDFRHMKLHELHGILVREDCEEKERPFCVAARGPYHIICATLNLTGARDLRALKRRTEQFIFSRLFTGSSRTGYVRTDTGFKDLTFSRAIGISGAAIAPIMGRMTTGFRSFACTILGIRLGQWLKNPKCIEEDMKKCLERKRKLRFFFLLLRELTGNVDAGEYVYISDGGHCGDNLGIVPLLKRRARLIICSDAECDPHYLFNSLNSSLREIYVDEGIKIDIKMPRDYLDPDPSDYKKNHFLVGRILYPDRPWQASWLVVLKSSLTGDELAPILNYKKKVKAFPHETTANQFFTEEQFEAYRALGRHVSEKTLSVAEKVKEKGSLWKNLDDLARDIEKNNCKEEKEKNKHSTREPHKWDDILRAMWDTEQYDFSSFKALRDSLLGKGDGPKKGTIEALKKWKDDSLVKDFLWLLELLKDEKWLCANNLLEKEVPKSIKKLKALEEVKSFPGSDCQKS